LIRQFEQKEIPKLNAKLIKDLEWSEENFDLLKEYTMKLLNEIIKKEEEKEKDD
jgi:hypothetical protein